ncbi:MAG TPA: hypothetical protein VMP13_09285 [Acidimicrobiia bacterium]|nr:hypothetical protein [Acidimicrobiia bacterium]
MPYHTVFVLQQERLGRYQAEAERSTQRRKDSDQFDFWLAVSRVLGLFAKRGLVRPAI